MHSQVVQSAEGGSVEVSLVGREGMVGLPAIFGVRYAAMQTVAQMQTTALRIGVDDFTRHLHGEHPLLRKLEKYAAVSLMTLAQIAGCNRLHDPQQRLSRWLLMVRDRVDGDRLSVTHEFLSLMLGTRRATVSEVAQALQRLGVIHYDRGVIEYRRRPPLGRTSLRMLRNYSPPLPQGWNTSDEIARIVIAVNFSMRACARYLTSDARGKNSQRTRLSKTTKRERYW